MQPEISNVGGWEVMGRWPWDAKRHAVSSVCLLTRAQVCALLPPPPPFTHTHTTHIHTHTIHMHTRAQMREAADVLRAQLAANPEDWAALTGYLDCLLPGSATAAGPTSSSTNSQQQQQQQQQPGMLTRPCASSSLLWFTGGLAARMHAGSIGASSQQQLPDGHHKVAPSRRQRAEDIEAALTEAHSTIEGMLSAVGAQQQPQHQDKGRQVTMRGPHLAKVCAQSIVILMWSLCFVCSPLFYGSLEHKSFSNYWAYVKRRKWTRRSQCGRKM
eukprot:1161226-Pelagomonas_calceolata.AAC.8